ncbi:MAG: SRPBCC domain-containing protein [Myxococcaceae bacterium]
MHQKPFTATITVPQSPAEVFAAVNDVRAWWTGKIDGPTDALNAEFTYRYEDFHRTTQKITALEPGKRIVWTVTDAKLPHFENPDEWNGTQIEFRITRAGEQTRLDFTHHGLDPSCQCYGDCSDAWTFFVTKSLESLIITGKGVAP